MEYRDILIFEKEHYDKARRIVDLFLEDTVSDGDSCYTGILCIGGVSGCGKTEIATICSDLLYRCNISSHIISLDKYYKIPAQQREAHRKETGVIGKDEMDWERIDEEIKYFSSNSIRVLIIEGIYAGYCAGISFLIDATIEETENFRMKRGKEKTGDTWRQFVVGEEMNAVKASQYLYSHII